MIKMVFEVILWIVNILEEIIYVVEERLQGGGDRGDVIVDKEKLQIS